jgi:hypothetical protein
MCDSKPDMKPKRSNALHYWDISSMKIMILEKQDKGIICANYKVICQDLHQIITQFSERIKPSHVKKTPVRVPLKCAT